MTDDTSNVTTLGVEWKSPPGDTESMLQIVNGGGCNHIHQINGGKIVSATYRIRQGETEVECGLCGARVDPMFVLMQVAQKESRWQYSRKMYAQEMERLADRRATKCTHCGRMTRISRAKKR